MTHRGPFQPQTFCDSVISFSQKSPEVHKNLLFLTLPLDTYIPAPKKCSLFEIIISNVFSAQYANQTLEN